MVEAIEASSSRLADSIRFSGLWLALIDGPLDVREFHEVGLAVEHEPEGVPLQQMVDALTGAFAPEQPPTRELPRIFRYLRANRSTRRTESLIDFYIRVAAADGRISQAERHALLFLSDVLSAPTRLLPERFDALLGIAFEPPADLSAAEHYQTVEAELTARQERLRQADRLQAGANPFAGQHTAKPAAASAGSNTAPAAAVIDPKRMQALLELGLKADATPIQIKAAWRKLSQKNHPDKFARADQATQTAAAAAFHTIQLAYDRLCEDDA